MRQPPNRRDHSLPPSFLPPLTSRRQPPNQRGRFLPPSCLPYAGPPPPFLPPRTLLHWRRAEALCRSAAAAGAVDVLARLAAAPLQRAAHKHKAWVRWEVGEGAWWVASDVESGWSIEEPAGRSGPSTAQAHARVHACADTRTHACLLVQRLHVHADMCRHAHAPRPCWRYPSSASRATRTARSVSAQSAAKASSQSDINCSNRATSLAGGKSTEKGGSTEKEC